MRGAVCDQVRSSRVWYPTIYVARRLYVLLRFLCNSPAPFSQYSLPLGETRQPLYLPSPPSACLIPQSYQQPPIKHPKLKSKSVSIMHNRVLLIVHPRKKVHKLSRNPSPSRRGPGDRRPCSEYTLGKKRENEHDEDANSCINEKQRSPRRRYSDRRATRCLRCTRHVWRHWHWQRCRRLRCQCHSCRTLLDHFRDTSLRSRNSCRLSLQRGLPGTHRRRIRRLCRCPRLLPQTMTAAVSVPCRRRTVGGHRVRKALDIALAACLAVPLARAARVHGHQRAGTVRGTPIWMWQSRTGEWKRPDRQQWMKRFRLSENVYVSFRMDYRRIRVARTALLVVCVPLRSSLASRHQLHRYRAAGRSLAIQ